MWQEDVREPVVSNLIVPSCGLQRSYRDVVRGPAVEFRSAPDLDLIRSELYLLRSQIVELKSLIFQSDVQREAETAR